MNDVNFKLLHTFLLVADCKSFRVAAQKSNRSPAAVTMQIKQLESQLGAILLERSPREVRLTPVGETLLALARKAVTEVGDGIRLIKQTVDRTKIDIGCTPSIAHDRLPKLMSAFRRENPQMTIAVHELNSMDIFGALRERTIALGIGPKFALTSEFSCELLAEDRVMALVPIDFDLGDRGTLSLGDILGLEHVMVKRGGVIHSAVNDAAKRLGLNLTFHHNLSCTETMVSMVQNGFGVALVAEHSIPSYALATLRAIPVSGMPRSLSINLIRLKDRDHSPAELAFSQALKRSFGRSSTLLPKEASSELPRPAWRRTKP